MYQTVYKALEEAGLEKTYVPQDYLNFFCLGNREVADVPSSGHLPANSPQVSVYVLSLEHISSFYTLHMLWLPPFFLLSQCQACNL